MSTFQAQDKNDLGKTSNEQFLKAIFGSRYPQCWVGSETDTTGGFATSKVNWLNRTTSCWFAVATIQPGSKSRSDPTFKEGVVVILDDVGTKLDYEIAKTAPPPTYKIETSPGNFQWGYVLKTPETDRQRWGAFRKLLAKSPKFSGGADGSGLAHYVRLPNGGYHKDAHLPADQRHETVMTEWSPHLRYELDELALAFGLDWTEASIAAAQSMKQGEAEVVKDAILLADPGYRMFAKLGWVHGGQKSNGWIDVRCPNEANHTKGGLSGSAYAVSAGNNREPDFKCHHSHCAGLRWKDGVEKLFWNDPQYSADYRAIVFPEPDDTIEDWEGKTEKDRWREAINRKGDPEKQEKFAEIELIDKISAYLPDVAKHYSNRATFKLEAYDAKDTTKRAAIKPRVFPRFYRNDVASIAAAPGIGKSLYALQFALAVAWEDPTPIAKNHAEKGIKIGWPGDVIVVANEDSISEVEMRLGAAIKHFGLDPNKQKHQIYIVARSEVKLVGVHPRDQNKLVFKCVDLLKGILGILERPEKPEIAAVFIDTLSSSMDTGIDESDPNVMQGVMDMASRLSESIFSSLVLIHHSSKVGAKEKESPSAYDALRGSSTIAGSIRGGIALTHLTSDDPARLGIPADKAAEYIRVVSIKNNYEKETGGALHYFKKVSIDMPAFDPRDGSLCTEQVGVLEEVFPKIKSDTEKLRDEWEKLKEARDRLQPGENITLGKSAPKGPAKTWTTAHSIFKRKTVDDSDDRVREIAKDYPGLVKIERIPVGSHNREIVVVFDAWESVETAGREDTVENEPY